jgi:hypothetical protein
MAVQPTHADVFRIANELCVSTITEMEEGMATQCMSDAAEAIRRQEEDALKVETARIVAEQGEQEKQAHLKRLEQDRLDIEAAERELKIRKQALHDAQKGPDAQKEPNVKKGPNTHNDAHDDDNDNDNDDSSVSTPDGHPVRRRLLYSVYSLLTVMSDVSGNDKAQDKASAG